MRGIRTANLDTDYLNSIQSPGTRAMNVLQLASNVANGETVTIGGSVFTVDTITTDTTRVCANGEWNNTNDPITVTVTAHGLNAGDLLRVQNEIVKIQRVVDANTVVVLRGRCGTTNATHADGQSIFKSAAPPATIPVGFNATFTPAVAGPAFAQEINNLPAGGVIGGVRCVTKASGVFGQVQAFSLASGAEVLLSAITAGVLALATTETLAGANNAWANATMVGGAAQGFRRLMRSSRVPTAVEVAIGTMEFVFPFTVAFADTDVVITATGVEKGWVGGILVSNLAAANGGGSRVAVDNTGATDWAATDTVTVVAFE